MGDAADANERLTQLDRRFRTEYLTEIARLRLRLGQADAAIQAAEDLAKERYAAAQLQAAE